MRWERLVLRRGEKPAHRINSFCVVAFLTAASGIFVRRLSFPLDSVSVRDGHQRITVRGQRRCSVTES